MTDKVIGTGGDYTTIASWFAACPADLVSTTQTWRGLLKNETFTLTTAITFSGITTSSTYYIELTTDTGASFADNANVQTNALRYNASNGAAIACSTNYVVPITNTASLHLRLTKLQIRLSGASASRVVEAYNNTIIDRCLFECQVPSSRSVVLLYGSGSRASNSVLISRSNSSPGPAASIGDGSSLYNCTLVATAATGSVALTGSYGSPTVRNCVSFGFTAIKSGGNTPTYTTCATEIASPPSGWTGSLTAANQVESLTDGTHDLRAKSGGSIIDAGTTDSTYAATDIAGTSRPSGASYDIGAWEFVSSGGSANGSAFGSGRALNGGRAFFGAMR